MIKNIFLLVFGVLIGLSANAQTTSWPNPSKPITFSTPSLLVAL